MYKKDALIQLINDLNSDRSHAIGIKLVRGAYLNQDKHLGVLCDNEHETHRQYDDAILQFVSLYKPRDQLLCATHNMRSVFVAKQYMNKYNLTNGNIGCVQIYNRALSASEVLSNYNGLRGRFGV